MLVADPKYRRPISQKQLVLLGLLYKFRFVTTDLIAEWLKKDRSTIYESLYVLEQQGYIYKFYNKTYRLRDRPAVYCLAAKGIKYLRDNTKLDEKTLKNFYKNKRMGQPQDEEEQQKYDAYIDSCLLVFKYFLTLKRQTNNRFKIYTKWELNRDMFPTPPPELLLENESDNEPDYVLDIFAPGTFSWLLRKRINQHKDAEDERGEYSYPHVLLVAQNESTQKRLFKMTYENYSDFSFYLTQQDDLLNSTDGKVWIDMEESEEDEFVLVGL